MTTPAPEQHTTGRQRMVPQVGALADLVGAHPDALLQIYRSGRPADPAELGDSPRGLFLAPIPGADLFLLTRPIMRALAKGWLPWQGKAFDHGGNAGQNVIFGQKMVRFHAEVAPSALDGNPSLILSYEGHGNPWPIRAIRDELRTVGDGVAVGPAFLVAGEPRPLFWFGLEIAR